MTYQSNSNAILFDNCNWLQNLSVLLHVVDTLTTGEGKGFTLQLNCYPPPGQMCQGQEVNWMQYMLKVRPNALYWQVQYWAVGQSGWQQGAPGQQGTTPWLPCWPNDFGMTQFGGAEADGSMAADSELSVALTTDRFQSITSVSFNVTDPQGNVQSDSFDLPVQFPIVAFQVNLVGPTAFSHATFTTGLTSSRGVLYYAVKPGSLSLQSGGLGAACGERGPLTGETSNAVYGDLSDTPAPTVTQSLGQPVDCALNHLFRRDIGSIKHMHTIREEHLTTSPAGQWINEVLHRHSAELAGLIVANPRLAKESRRLLRAAIEVALDGSMFGNDLIDRALRLVDRASCRLPASLPPGTAAATRTVLEAMRGKSLEVGIVDASQTIRPQRPGY